MKILCIDALKNPLWQNFIERYQASLFHSPLWFRVLKDAYGFDIQAYILLNEAEESIAGIPFCKVSDVLGDRIISLPFSDYCDPLFEDSKGCLKLIEKLCENNIPIALRCRENSDFPRDGRLRIAKKAKWHGLNLQADLEAIWKNLRSSAQRGVRKAQKDGVTVEIASTEEALEKFFTLHLHTRKQKYRLLAQPYEFFERIWEHFFDAKSLYLMNAQHQGEVIASTLFLGWNNCLYYKFNASDARHLIHRPNNVLVWEGIKLGKKLGYDSLDFGLSDSDQEGLLRFKRQFGPHERNILSWQFVPDGQNKESDPRIKNLLHDLTRLFTDEAVPDHITALGGDMLYRFFV